MNYVTRKQAYQTYLQTPKAKVEKILDELDEERIKRIEKESKKAMRKIRLLARRAFIPLIILMFATSVHAMKVPVPDPKDTETIGTIRVFVVVGEKAKELRDAWKATAKIFEDHGALVLLQPDVPSKDGEPDIKDAGMFDFVIVTGDSADAMIAATNGKDILLDFDKKIIYHIMVPKRMNI